MGRMDTLFAPPTLEWRRPSPRYLGMKMVLICTVWPALIAAATVAAWLAGPDWAWWVVLGVGLVVWAWRIIRQPRAFRRWGYAETDTDVYLTRGLAWRQLTAVPYGRLQLVNVSSGPIERAFGIASVEMVTSSTAGTIHIPGLAIDDATALRDRLMERGELLQAGI